MKINFYPEYDNVEFEKAAREYEKIWKEEGNKIIATIEKVSGLKFKEKIINAIVCEYISFSNPLRLQSNISIKHKRGDIIHELCHRLMYGNNIKPKVDYTDPNYRLEGHKHINPILYDILVDIYGEEFAKERVKYEISLWEGKGVSPYKLAWDWALSMTKNEREKEFKNLLRP